MIFPGLEPKALSPGYSQTLENHYVTGKETLYNTDLLV